MIRRCRENVLAAERRRYGTGPLAFVRRLLASDLPSWRLSGAGLATVVWRLVPRWLWVAAGAFALVWLLAGALMLVALAQLLG